MKCIKCNAIMPFNTAEPLVTDCIFCDSKQYPDAVDLLSEPVLNFVHETRDGQIEMCREITEAITANTACMYEAGTGVGKSYAYLLPSIISGERVVISTAKKTLQGQLLDKDLPRIRTFLQSIGHPRGSFNFAGAYGRSNFGCKLKAEKTYGDSAKWTNYENFFKKSKYGHWDDVQKLHLRKLDMSQNAESCVGAECKYYRTCGFPSARTDMLAADVVVTNNWLLGYHYRMLREFPDQPGRLLGPFAYLIVDEAHKIEDGIRSAFTNETSMGHVDKLHAQLDNLNMVSAHVVPTDDISHLSNEMLAAFDSLSHEKNTDKSKPIVGPARTAVGAVELRLAYIRTELLKPTVLPHLFHEPRTPTLNAFHKRLVMKGCKEDVTATEQDDSTARITASAFPANEEDQKVYLALDSVLNTLDDCYSAFNALMSQRNNRVWTIEMEFVKGKVNHVLKDMPVEIGSYLPEKGVTYLSATLANNSTFDTFAARVGLSRVPHKSGIFPSPFNLARQAYLFVPEFKDMPEPVNDKSARGSTLTPARTEYLDKLGYHIHQLIDASQGDALVLFTAKTDLDYIEQYLIQQGYPHPVIAQGAYKPNEAFDAYKNTHKATLLGLKSFWEGIDVQGDKLFMVIITKLPMPLESDPVVKARLGRYPEEEMWQGFMKVKYPEMLSDLRQGLGRLIRSKTDRGVVVILDTRVRTKKYGSQLLTAIGLKPISNLEKMCAAIRTRHEP